MENVGLSEEFKKEIREHVTGTKEGAAWQSKLDLGEFIVFSALAKQYFGRTGNWLLQRYSGLKVNGKPARFKPEEYDKLSAAYRDIAAKLMRAADEIDAATELE